MKMNELRQKSNTELRTLLKETQGHLRELRWQRGERKLKNVHEMAVARRTIARILTILNQ